MNPSKVHGLKNKAGDNKKVCLQIHIYKNIQKLDINKIEFIIIFFWLSMTGLMGCSNLNCTQVISVRRLLAAVHMRRVRIE